MISWRSRARSTARSKGRQASSPATSASPTRSRAGSRPERSASTPTMSSTSPCLLAASSSQGSAARWAGRQSPSTPTSSRSASLSDVIEVLRAAPVGRAQNAMTSCDSGTALHVRHCRSSSSAGVRWTNWPSTTVTRQLSHCPTLQPLGIAIPAFSPASRIDP